MSTATPMSEAQFEFPDYQPPAPRAEDKWYQKAIDTAVAVFTGLLPLFIMILLIGVFAMGPFHFLAGEVPAWLSIGVGVYAATLAGIFILGLVGTGVLAIVVGAPEMMQAWRDRKYPVDLSDGFNAYVVRSLEALGLKDARAVVGNSPLNVEAYRRVRLKAVRIAMAQGMSTDEASHHAHNMGLLMYPGTAGLAREVPLMRVLEDRGVTNANDARDALTEPQYASFAVPVPEEEIVESLKPVDPSKVVDYETVYSLEKKINQGYKPTSEERAMIKATNGRLEKMGMQFAILKVIAVAFFGVLFTGALTVPFAMSGLVLAAVAVGVVGVLATIGALTIAE